METEAKFGIFVECKKFCDNREIKLHAQEF